ncbi:uncharacterized protein M421DRAFT_92262 [Didymella exigua CBS 183.55]|uniref:DUF7918 domain-containing protein n=1 Tax=Didymella exigua CBS 183.55 TaxID=1150837 RepID=A0A6A5RJG9_9PLEO|nr:uncharacterized protein M421DRAFT_92262 [Didymella exigua CBS 183.55]KAF1928525.1 hypothetical protein M421DRAFT_92262 [Didymella exigua CBS 183.55]
MAITPAIPGLEVTVKVDNVALPEYEYEYDNENATNADDDADTKSTNKYLELPCGTEFSVRTMFRQPLDVTLQVHTDLYIDNNYLSALLRETGDKDDSKSTNDKTHPTEGIQLKLRGVGTIRVYLYRVARESRTDALRILRQDLDQLAPMNEKVSQKCAPPLLSSEFRMPEVEKVLFAAYTFFYRSTRAFKSLGVIPRSLSPERSPTAEPGDPLSAQRLANMGRDQLIASLEKIMHSGKTTGVKREREREDDDAVNDAGETAGRRGGERERIPQRFVWIEIRNGIDLRWFEDLKGHQSGERRILDHTSRQLHQPGCLLLDGSRLGIADLSL